MCRMGKGKACQTPGWSRGGPLCSLVPILPLQDHFQWPRDCSMIQGSTKKETLSQIHFQSAFCETLGHPTICLVKGRVPVQFGPNAMA